MKNVVLSKNVERKYYVEKNQREIHENGEIKYIFDRRPELKFDDKEVGWKRECEFDGDVRFNDRCSLLWESSNALNISENETVEIVKRIFRADIPEVQLYSDKVNVKEDDEKEKQENYYKKLLKRYNSEKIKADEKLLNYCQIHRLKVEDTDYEELKKLVYPAINTTPLPIKADGIAVGNVAKYYKNLITL